MKIDWVNAINRYLRILSFVLLTIFFNGPFSISSHAALITEIDFETGDLCGFRTEGTPPVVTSLLSRAGAYSLESSMNPGGTRSEATEWLTVNVGEEYWYGFSIFLPEGYIVNDSWEILAQWHGAPDWDIGEDWRNPVMNLSSSHGIWSVALRYDSKINTFESGKKVYDGIKGFSFGPYETGVWTDWVFHIKWSYNSDGFVEIWKNGVKVLNYEGPCAYNDARGPYFKMGIYAGDVPGTRVVYHDEFRMADANSTYEDVAPGGNSPEPEVVATSENLPDPEPEVGIPLEPSVPGTATLLSPSGKIKDETPTYTWNAVEGATRYQLKVRDRLLKKIVFKQWYDANNITSGGICSVTSGVALARGKYKWKVRAANDNGKGNWRGKRFKVRR